MVVLPPMTPTLLSRLAEVSSKFIVSLETQRSRDMLDPDGRREDEQSGARRRDPTQ
jgi:hypothetical protein